MTCLNGSITRGGTAHPQVIVDVYGGLAPKNNSKRHLGEGDWKMRQLFALALGVVIAIAGLMIGTAVVTKTFATVNSTTPSTTLTQVNADAATSLTTFSGFIPVVVIAAVGGLALLYLIFYLGGGQQQQI